MTYILPITEFRKNIFSITERVARTGDPVDVEKEGKRIVRVTAIKDDPAEKANYVLEHVLPKLAGAWENMTKKDLARVRSLRRGAVERRYWKRPIFS